MVQALSPEQLEAQVGPVVLIQRPAAPVLQQVAMQLGASRTVSMSTRNRLVDEIFAMVRGFDYLAVCLLPPLGEARQIVVGRTAGCDLVVDEPSVSKRHAVVRWDAARGGCSVRDLGSTNGTFVGAKELGREEERPLEDGDVVSFGDAQFMYFLTHSLHEILAGAGLARR
jgi:hypothetical protein